MQRRWSQALSSGAWWQDQRQQAQTETREVTPSVSGNTFLLWEWLSTGRGCPGRLWSLHLGVTQKPPAQSRQQAVGEPNPEQGCGLGDLQRPLPTSMFYNSVIDYKRKLLRKNNYFPLQCSLQTWRVYMSRHCLSVESSHSSLVHLCSVGACWCWSWASAETTASTRGGEWWFITCFVLFADWLMCSC